MNEVTNQNLFVLSRHEDFSQKEINWLAELVHEKATDKGIKAAMYFFEIHVEYVPSEETSK